MAKPPVTPRIRKPAVTPAGYHAVTITLNGKSCREFVHSLVLEAFVGPRPEGAVSRHFPDGTKTNNHVSNLQWATQKENMGDRPAQGTHVRGSQIANARLNEAKVAEILRRLSTGEKQCAIAADFGVYYSVISKIHKGLIWKHVPRPVVAA